MPQPRNKVLHGTSYSMHGVMYRATDGVVTLMKKFFILGCSIFVASCGTPGTCPVPTHSEGKVLYQTKAFSENEWDSWLELESEFKPDPSCMNEERVQLAAELCGTCQFFCVNTRISDLGYKRAVALLKACATSVENT